MGKKNKAKNRQKKQQRAQEKKQRQERRRAKRASGSSAPAAQHLPSAVLTPPHPERLRPPVFVDDKGQLVPDPYALLDLTPGEGDEATIRQAWRRAIERHPPESDPDGARQLREARDRLLADGRYLERALGELRAPDADAWGLPDTPDAHEVPRLAAADRLVGQAVLYALVDEALQQG